MSGDDWRPDGPATVVIGFPLGGGSDIIGRPTFDELQKLWGVPINVENRPGANGVTAALEIADAPPNGRTILLGHVSTNVIAPVVLEDDAVVEHLACLQPVTLLASQAHVLVVNASSPDATLSEFVATARRANGQLTYGSTGHGSMQQLVAEQFARLAKIELRHMPYLGSTPAMADLRMGRIDCIFEGIVPAAPFIEDGIFRALALSVPRRIPGLEIPSFAELGYPQFDMRGWWGFFAPPGTPDAVRTGWQRGLAAALRYPRVRNLAASLGVELSGESSAKFAEFIRLERVRYSHIAAFLNLAESRHEFTAPARRQVV
ncbi:MAG: tripartite tricarboxylate transporter substrate binding protein [Alphaproteobacteria bacterium]|nr:tripartite tricarboxylate transporter substrate binding protein [Alphaproteobacteria bacterium]